MIRNSKAIVWTQPMRQAYAEARRRMWTMEQAAARIGVSCSAIRYAIRDGVLPPWHGRNRARPRFRDLRVVVVPGSALEMLREGKNA